MIDALRDRIAPGQRPPLPEVDIDPDDLFFALSCERRRLLIDYVDELPNGAELTDLADYIAAEQQESTIEALSSAERKRVYVALYQGHAPKLDDLGIVRFTERGRVRPTEKTAAVAEIVRQTAAATGGGQA